ncbi:MAG: glycoside hydrolase family 18 protein, partial [Verrucomicrobiota bacterium]
DGRSDLGSNGIWIQHGWLGDDGWFKTHGRDKTKFRSAERINALVQQLQAHNFRYVFPHLAPALLNGQLMEADEAQTELFLDHCAAADIEVIPWIGGVFGFHCQLEDPEWRATFANSIAQLLDKHPRLAGVQLNVEPLPSGNANFLKLLDEIREVMPKDKKLSIAAYPPPTIHQRSLEVHWNEAYYQEVASRADQLAVMMYDTGVAWEKLYVQLMANWTEQLLEWTPTDCEILLGLPAYADEGVEYHSPLVENLESGLAGVHAGLARFEELPPNYRGVAIYSEWEMDTGEWDLLRTRFCADHSK